MGAALRPEGSPCRTDPPLQPWQLQQVSTERAGPPLGRDCPDDLPLKPCWHAPSFTLRRIWNLLGLESLWTGAHQQQLWGSNDLPELSWVGNGCSLVEP